MDGRKAVEIERLLRLPLADFGRYGGCGIGIVKYEDKRRFLWSFMNRSFQEKISDYTTVKNFFANHFKDADIAILSSHLVIVDILKKIRKTYRKPVLLPQYI
jgi:hypothetical protein